MKDKTMTTIVIDDDPQVKYPTIPTLKNVKVCIRSHSLNYKLQKVVAAKHEAQMLYDGYEFIERSKAVQESLQKEAYDFLKDQAFSAWDEKAKERNELQNDALVYLALMLIDYLDIGIDKSNIGVDALRA